MVALLTNLAECYFQLWVLLGASQNDVPAGIMHGKVIHIDASVIELFRTVHPAKTKQQSQHYIFD